MEIAIIGLGNRGRLSYLANIVNYPDMEVTALCDINHAILDNTAEEYAPNARLFYDEDSFFAAGKLADWLVIATNDRDHYRHAMEALRQGYHLLLEKPVTGDERELDEIIAYAKEKERTVLVCHVLRYAPFYRTIKEVLDSGEIGEIVSIVHQENIGYWHFAHSYTRGNWRNETTSAPMLLAKCCHDFDLFAWYIGRDCRKISSYGGLKHFCKTEMPEGATEYCLGGCRVKKSCPYDAEQTYILDKDSQNYWKRPQITGLPEPTDEETRQALQTGEYGKCVYQCDNNVFDHQTVNMEFDGGVTVVFSVSAFSKECYRQIHIMGTKGELSGVDMDNVVTVHRFGGETEQFEVQQSGGHIGGDSGIVEGLHRIMKGKPIDKHHLTTIDVTAKSHKMVYAATKSVETGETISL